MKTNHVDSVGEVNARPETLPVMKPEMLCKGKYRDGEKLCYTGWLLELFLDDYPAAYREFRLKTMDILYDRYDKDRAENAEQRADVFNAAAQELGYEQIHYVVATGEEAAPQ